MKFIYTGNPTSNYYGHDLKDGCEIEVTGALLNKFKSNSAFKEVRNTKKKAKAKAEEKGDDES